MEKRNHTIDLLKGAAILMIIVTHYDWTPEQRNFFLFPYVINMAVPILMVITGYVYSMSISKQHIFHLEKDKYPELSII